MIKELTNYIVSPHHYIAKYTKPLLVIKWILFLLLVDIAITYLIGISFEKTGLSQDIFGHSQNSNESNFLLFQIIILGVAEEIIFRAPLKYSTYTPPLLLCLILIFSLTFLRHFLGMEHVLAKVSAIVITLIVSTLFYFAYKNHKFNDLLKSFWTKNFKYIFFTSAILFSLVHAIEFEINSVFVFIMATTFSSVQFLGALIFSFARMKIGLWASIVIHILSNLGIDYVWNLGEYLLEAISSL
ncbi:CPBP family glutamic-type intramembrane protease [Saccharicrinis aurantiacus]|uniref:CPBP family glutamic-type intramembrane protease n=1 Tax=Saccharicrinis aurantiacus TaxID=1849719 RepID=UPI000838B587|nr:CPBP family glutamic-type intramembrane protease [Saccharicrinis aurantiacus]